MIHRRLPIAPLCAALIALSLLAGAAGALAADGDAKPLKLNGSGASFPAPLYLRWFRDYYLAHPEVEMDYQSTASAGGVRDLTDGRVDFAATDVPLTDEQAADIADGTMQVPMAAGGIVLVYQLDGVPDLKLSRDALVGIFSGMIARWNDPAIAATNPDAALPDAPITVVARADTSGTSYKFTRHLSALSDEFAEQVGTSMQPNWPQALKRRGALVRGRGNDGVAASVRAIPGSIGYVQYAFGFLPGIAIAALENRAGELVAPSAAGFDAALASVRDKPGIDIATDPSGAASYPIVGLSWLVLRKAYDDPTKLPALKEVIAYAMGPGQEVTEMLGYVRFPPGLIDHVRELLK